MEEIKKSDIEIPHDLCVLVSQREVEISRQLIKSGKSIAKDKVIESVLVKLKFFSNSVLRRLINATGIIVHTNLGRSPLNESVAKEVAKIATNYSNLEYDLFNNKRGKRDSLVRDLLVALT
ncbi:MAG: L-seryl-tRNA(Sec) selenium transferase, partial [Thermodesulfobium sp.]